MENAELEVALEELETRLERLRALYEQYFMGIERIEPAIPRKDIDRRIYVLRREKIRNTAKRFKLQTIISRYNTFQQYWQRICREIEQGTYKRHVIKAERIAPGKMLTIAARKRLGRAALEAMAPGEAPEEAASPPSTPPTAIPTPAVGEPAASSAPRLAPPPKPVPPAKPVPPPKPGARPAKPAPAAEAQGAEPRAAFENLDMDWDFLGDWDPSAAAKPAPKRPPEVPARAFGQPLSRPLGTPAAAPGAVRAPVASSVEARPRSAPPPKPVRPTATAPASPMTPTSPAHPTAATGAATPPARPLGAASQGMSPARLALPVRPPMPERPSPPPAAAKPLAAPIPGAAPPKPDMEKRAAIPSAAVGDDRVRELHARLVEAKRQTQDSTSVSMEGLAKSMKATEAKLREQHKNRKIDFDVVIKDGKAVLKPIVR